jgi:hypothetical protein
MTIASAPAARQERGPATLGRIVYENGLSIVLLFTFLMLLWGQTMTGWKAFNNDQEEHGHPKIGYRQYLVSGHCIEATAENWESEFLQMAAFVWLTVFLVQKGSPESKNADGDKEEVDRDPDPNKPDAPWPVRRGGLALKLYCNSLTLAFLLMFLIAFLLHAAGGAIDYSREQQAHGQPAVSMIQFMGTAEFWFQALQNWQSEFLAIAAMVILTVFLRQKGSPESKPVDSPHWENE